MPPRVPSGRPAPTCCTVSAMAAPGSVRRVQRASPHRQGETWASLRPPWSSAAVLQTPREGSSGRVPREGPQGGWPPLSCVGRVTAASDRGRCGARTAGTGLRTRAVHLCLRRVCPGTTAELSTRGALGVRLRVPAPAAHSAHPANTKHLRL